MTVEVPLTQGFVALVDDDDADAVLSAGSWHIHRHHGNTVYAIRRPYPTRTRVWMHQLLTGWLLTDHINGNGLDNRRSNLRPASNAQNVANSGLRADNRSGFKGVFLDRRSGLWSAQIGHQGHRRFLGYHDTPQDAARAYDHAARDLFGEFARLNFPTTLTERTPA